MTDDGKDVLGTLAKNAVRVIIGVALTVIAWTGNRFVDNMETQGKDIAEIKAHMQVMDATVADVRDIKARRDDYIRWRATVDDHNAQTDHRLEQLENFRSTPK